MLQAGCSVVYKQEATTTQTALPQKMKNLFPLALAASAIFTPSLLFAAEDARALETCRRAGNPEALCRLKVYGS